MSNFEVKRGDCFSYFPKIPDNSIDLILTDPPYNLGKCSTGNIKFKGRKYFNLDVAEWDKKPLNIPDLSMEFQRILNPKGNIFIFTGYNLLGEYHVNFNPFFTFQVLVWHKTNPPPQIRKTSFVSSCEMVVCLWNKGHNWNFLKQTEMHNFYEGPICGGNERSDHPTQKTLAYFKAFNKDRKQ